MASLRLMAIVLIGCWNAGACNHGHRPAAPLRVTSMVPDAGAIDVPRDVTIRVEFDQDIDEASCNSTTFQLAGPQGPVPATVACDAPARVAWLAPLSHLARTTVYQVTLTTGLRSVGGAHTAVAQSWSFTTDDHLLWTLPTELADGRLLALVASPTGVVHALWTAADLSLQLAMQNGLWWSPPEPLPIPAAEEAALAIDDLGRVVVAVRTADPVGELWVTTWTPGAGFAAPTSIATGVTGKVAVAASSSGAVLVGWTVGISGRVRALVPGSGWGAEQVLGNGVPRVWLDPLGHGHAVYGQHRAVSSPPTNLVWCERRCIDPTGTWTVCDPPLAIANDTVDATEAAFLADGSVLVQQRSTDFNGIEWLPHTRLFEWAPAAGWNGLPPDATAPVEYPYDNSLALAATGDALFVTATSFGTLVRAHRRRDRTAPWVETRIDGSLVPDPYIQTAAVLTGEQEALALWTTRIDPEGTTSRNTWVVAAAQPTSGSWTPPAHLNRLPLPLQGVDLLRAVADARGGAVVAWSAGGVVVTCTRR